MEYNKDLWTNYTFENEDTLQTEISKLIYYLSLGLGTKNICEAGCNIGNNLSEFPKDFNVNGFDMNETALEKARKKYPTFHFFKENINKTSFYNQQFDLVFTRGVLIHISKEGIQDALNELFRISKKWIFNLEYFGEDGKMIKWKRGDELLWYRNMKQLWNNYDVEMISNIDIPLEIDSGKMKLTLVKKKF